MLLEVVDECLVCGDGLVLAVEFALQSGDDFDLRRDDVILGSEECGHGRVECRLSRGRLLFRHVLRQHHVALAPQKVDVKHTACSLLQTGDEAVRDCRVAMDYVGDGVWVDAHFRSQQDVCSEILSVLAFKVNERGSKILVARRVLDWVSFSCHESLSLLNLTRYPSKHEDVQTFLFIFALPDVLIS